MTGHHEPPDVTQRRRVARLRAELGLGPVPTYVGAELRTVAALITGQVELRLRDEVPRYAVLSPDGQRRLDTSLQRAVEEFTRIVEERPLVNPAVALVLADGIHEVDQPERFLLALHTGFEVVREVMREFWGRLPHARPFSNRLDAALAEYIERLCSRTINAHHPPETGPQARRRAEEARVGSLLALAERRWAGKRVRLCVIVCALSEQDDTTGAPAHHHPVAPDRRDGPYPLRLVATDHILIVAEQTGGPASRVARTASTVAVRVGPVHVRELDAAYEAALLLFRLVSAGVAAAPPPALIPPPNLGFLRPRPTEGTVAKIAELLRPLTKQSAHRRVTLARTMQLRLRTAGTAQALADHLGMHAQSVRNHLGTLRNLYGNQDLDFGEDTLAIQAALDMVLPLWELESTGRTGPATHHPSREPRTLRKPPREEDLP